MIEDSIAKSRQRFAALVHDMAEIGTARPQYRQTSVHESPGFEVTPKGIMRKRSSFSIEKENQPPNLLSKHSVQRSEISKTENSLRAVNRSFSIEDEKKQDTSFHEEKSVDTLSEYLGLGKKKENNNDLNQSGYVLVPREDESVVTSKCMRFCEDLSHLSMKIDQCSIYSVKSTKSMKSIFTPKSNKKSVEIKRQERSLESQKKPPLEQVKQPSVREISLPTSTLAVPISSVEKFEKIEPLTEADILKEACSFIIEISKKIEKISKGDYQLGKILRTMSQKYGIHSEKMAAVGKRLALAFKESAGLMTSNEYFLNIRIVVKIYCSKISEEECSTQFWMSFRKKSLQAKVDCWTMTAFFYQKSLRF